MEETNVTLLIVMLSIFAFSVFVYMLLMVFFPEWVGITGKETKEAERKRQAGETVHDGDDLITKWSKAEEKPKTDL